MWDNPEETFDKGTGEFSPDNDIPIGDSVTRTLAEGLNMSERQYYGSYKHLRELGYIDDTHITIIEGCFSRGFIEICAECCLSGYALVLYSYLCYKSKKYGWIDKYHSAMAQELRTSRSYLERMLTSLKSKHLIRYKRRGKQCLICPLE